MRRSDEKWGCSDSGPRRASVSQWRQGPGGWESRQVWVPSIEGLRRSRSGDFHMDVRLWLPRGATARERAT